MKPSLIGIVFFCYCSLTPPPGGVCVLSACVQKVTHPLLEGATNRRGPKQELNR